MGIEAFAELEDMARYAVEHYYPRLSAADMRWVLVEATGRILPEVDLDMAASWTPTAANFLGRVTKARIQQAVAEARGQRAADRRRLLHLHRPARLVANHAMRLHASPHR